MYRLMLSTGNRVKTNPVNSPALLRMIRRAGWKVWCSVLLMGVMVVCWSGPAYPAETSRPHLTGKLTAIEDDTVVIDNGGYLLDRSVRVLDSSGKRSSLDMFTLPAKVYIEYVYTEKGPIIKLIREVGQ